MDHSNATKDGGTGLHRRGREREGSGGEGRGDTQIRIHFQPGHWNSFVPATGLGPP